MASGSGAGTRTPYAVCIRYTTATGGHEDTIIHARRDLAAALIEIHALTLAWTRLVWDQPLPIEALVIDVRDCTEWHQGLHPNGEHDHARKIQGHWYHWRHRGAAVGAPARRWPRRRPDPTRYLTR